MARAVKTDPDLCTGASDGNSDYAQLFDSFVASAVAGRIVVCRAVKDACQRHLDDMDKARKGQFPYVFDCDFADQACAFIEGLKLSTGEWSGSQFRLQPWQVFVVRSIFGWRHKDTGFRRFKVAYISVARGNGKSPLAAAILLLLFAFDCPSEDRAECYCVATKRDQAKIVFNECTRFVENSPRLRSIISRRMLSLSIDGNGSTLQPLGSDSKFMDGLVPHGIVVDEMHAMHERHRELLEKLHTAMGKRRQPLLLYVTTAGNEKSKLWRETYMLCKQVVSRESPVEVESTFVFIAELDTDDDPFKESNWPKANPMLGTGIIKPQNLIDERTKAQVSPVHRVPFIRYYCNRYVTSDDKPITPEIWARGGGDLPDLAGRQCRMGFDWGWRDDLTALSLVFPLDMVKVGGEFKRRYAVKCWCWIPSKGKRAIHREPWASWILQRHLIATRGESTDTDSIWSKFLELRQQYWIQSVALDGNNAREFGTKLVNHLGIDVYEFPQSTRKYHEPSREFCQALAEGRILHGNSPLLSWAAQNLILDGDQAGYVMPSKKSSEDKIDPITATIMALSECMFNDTIPQGITDDQSTLLI